MNHAGSRQSPGDQEFRAAQLKSTGQTADHFKQGLERTLRQIDSGYRSTMVMYQVTFYLGVALVVVAAVQAASGKTSYLTLALGGVGMLDLLGFLIVQPAKNLQDSRATLTQLQAAYFTWFTDIYNWNSYLIAADKTGSMDFATVKDVSEATLRTTEKVVAMVDRYCKKGNSTSDSSSAGSAAEEDDATDRLSAGR